MTNFAIAIVAAAGLIAVGSVAVYAGECPADQVRENAVTTGPATHSGATDTVIASNMLGEMFTELDGREQRLRYLTVEPGGEIAWHDHMDRPAIIYILEGSILEYRNTCAVPIEHVAGDVANEFGTIQHWWKNESNQTVKLLSTDLLRVDPVQGVKHASK